MSINLNDGREFLSYVSEKLREKTKQLDISILESQQDIEQMHEYYWENYTEMDEYGYENYDNRQALFREMQFNENDRHARRKLVRMIDNPFFGRVDFIYEGDDEPEIFYIGIGNFAEEHGAVPLIYDWRAPVSGLFYDYEKGPASYTAPAGVLSGEITSRRQYKIRGGRMIYELESDIKIDDEVLMQELGSAGQDKLRNIVRTIQKEQNAIIRNTTDRIMVIQGAAGSGKTSIALHRIAYLLYHDRVNLKSSNILILSPNGIFADYISQILPELGEENIRELTFDLYAYKQLKDIVNDCEDRYDLLEQRLAGIESMNPLFEYKQSREFADLLESYILTLEDELMNFHDVKYRGSTITDSEIIDLFYYRFTEAPLLSRMQEIADYYIDQIETLRQKDLEPEEKDLLRQEFLSMYETMDYYEIYRRFLDFAGLSVLPDVPQEKRYLRYEDVYPLLYLKNRLMCSRPDPTVRHLIVDEMQDYTWIQYAVLHQMFNCPMTILGDRAQTLGDKPNDVLTFLPGILGKNIRTIVINKCYRNTMEIAEYANQLAGITGLELIERHGSPVTERTFGTREEALTFIAELAASASSETAAVITANEKDAAEAAHKLKELLESRGYDTEKRFSHLHRNSRSFKKGLTVTTYYLAKGLEFDRVYMLFPACAGGGESKLIVNAKYVAATRAMHELFVCEYE